MIQWWHVIKRLHDYKDHDPYYVISAGRNDIEQMILHGIIVQNASHEHVEMKFYLAYI